MIDRNVIIQKLKLFKEEKAKEYNIDKLGIFGSVARNEQDENSDIDICMSYTEPLDLMQLSKIQKELENLLYNRVDLVTIHEYLQPIFLDNLNNDTIYV